MALFHFFLFFLYFLLHILLLLVSCSPYSFVVQLKTKTNSKKQQKSHQGHGYKFGYEITDPHGAKNSRHETDDGHGNKVCDVLILYVLLSMLIINFKKTLIILSSLNIVPNSTVPTLSTTRMVESESWNM